VRRRATVKPKLHVGGRRPRAPRRSPRSRRLPQPQGHVGRHGRRRRRL